MSPRVRGAPPPGWDPAGPRDRVRGCSDCISAPLMRNVARAGGCSEANGACWFGTSYAELLRRQRKAIQALRELQAIQLCCGCQRDSKSCRLAAWLPTIDLGVTDLLPSPSDYASGYMKPSQLFHEAEAALVRPQPVARHILQCRGAHPCTLPP